MEQVSGEKANIDQKKGQTLNEMSSLVLELNQRIATKKAQLAPIIKGKHWINFYSIELKDLHPRHWSGWVLRVNCLSPSFLSPTSQQ